MFFWILYSFISFISLDRDVTCRCDFFSFAAEGPPVESYKTVSPSGGMCTCQITVERQTSMSFGYLRNGKPSDPSSLEYCSFVISGPKDIARSLMVLVFNVMQL